MNEIAQAAEFDDCRQQRANPAVGQASSEPLRNTFSTPDNSG